MRCDLLISSSPFLIKRYPDPERTAREITEADVNVGTENSARLGHHAIIQQSNPPPVEPFKNGQHHEFVWAV
jgi:hypothetical protein